MSEREINVMHNLSDCRNRVHDFCNNVVPSLLKSLAEGFKLTNGYQLYQKDKDRLQAALDNAAKRGKLSQGNDSCKGSSAFIRSNEYDVMLEVSDNYPVKCHTPPLGYTSEYYKKTVYLWNNREDTVTEFKQLPLTTHHEMDAACVEAKEIEAEISSLQDRLYPLKRLIGG